MSTSHPRGAQSAAQALLALAQAGSPPTDQLDYNQIPVDPPTFDSLLFGGPCIGPDSTSPGLGFLDPHDHCEPADDERLSSAGPSHIFGHPNDITDGVEFKKAVAPSEIISPSYEAMIVEAMRVLDSRREDEGNTIGYKPQHIFSIMAELYGDWLPQNFRGSATQALKKAVRKGRVERTRRWYKLNPHFQGPCAHGRRKPNTALGTAAVSNALSNLNMSRKKLQFAVDPDDSLAAAPLLKKPVHSTSPLPTRSNVSRKNKHSAPISYSQESTLISHPAHISTSSPNSVLHVHPNEPFVSSPQVTMTPRTLSIFAPHSTTTSPVVDTMEHPAMAQSSSFDLLTPSMTPLPRGASVQARPLQQHSLWDSTLFDMDLGNPSMLPSPALTIGHGVSLPTCSKPSPMVIEGSKHASFLVNLQDGHDNLDIAPSALDELGTLPLSVPVFPMHSAVPEHVSSNADATHLDLEEFFRPEPSSLFCAASLQQLLNEAAEGKHPIPGDSEYLHQLCSYDGSQKYLAPAVLQVQSGLCPGSLGKMELPPPAVFQLFETSSSAVPNSSSPLCDRNSSTTYQLDGQTPSAIIQNPSCTSIMSDTSPNDTVTMNFWDDMLSTFLTPQL